MLMRDNLTALALKLCINRPCFLIFFLLLHLVKMRREANNLQISFLLRLLTALFHLYDESGCGLRLRCECQKYFLDSALTLPSILYASRESLCPMDFPTLAVFYLLERRISIKRNLFCSFFLPCLFFCQLANLLFLVLPVFRNL